MPLEQKLKSALLTKNDLPEDFGEEDPQAALGPAFVSGDEAGRRLVDLTNLLAEGTDQDNITTAHVMFGNPAGSFLYNNVGSYPVDRARQLFDEFTAAAADCKAYVMALRDGDQVTIEQVEVSDVELGDGAQRVRWVTKVPGFNIETAWIIARVDGVLTLVNTRFPDPGELERLAAISVNRVREANHQMA
jgi:hypothetical protein